MINRHDRIDKALEAAVETSNRFANIIEFMAAIEREVPDVREEEIAAALRRSVETDTVESSRDFKLDAVQQIEEFIEGVAALRRRRLQ